VCFFLTTGWTGADTDVHAEDVSAAADPAHALQEMEGANHGAREQRNGQEATASAANAF
jgi:hypothetical protein